MRNIKKGDNVLVITGKDKGRSGKVLEVNGGKALVENINIVTRHQKPKSQQDKGGKIKKPSPIDVSNIQLICSSCGKATRVAHIEVQGKNVRICKKCNASLEKEIKKAVKKESKQIKKNEATKLTASVPVTESKKSATKELKDSSKTVSSKAQITKQVKSNVRKTITSGK